MLHPDPLDLGELGEDLEATLLRRSGGVGMLAPVARHDRLARPVVLVHGIKGDPGELRPIAEHLLLSPRRLQPYVFIHDDLGRYLDRSGEDLACGLAELACRAPRPTLAIVAHSMGGIVGRCALNSMTDPRWFPAVAHRALRRERARIRSAPRPERPGRRLTGPCVADFAAIDLLAIDTPWGGFMNPRVDLRDLWPRERAWVDMVSNSAVLTRLGVPVLPDHVAVHHIEADQVRAGAEPDRIRTLGDLDDGALARVQRAILGDTAALGPDRRLHNLFAALTDESSFAELAADLRARPCGPAALRRRLLRAVPRLAGTHTSVLRNPALFPLLDRLLATRGAPR